MAKKRRAKIPPSQQQLYDTFFSEDVDGNLLIRCVVHEEREPDCHHLFEDPSKSECFFENLVPICSNLNDAIQRTRSRKLVTDPGISALELQGIAFRRYGDARFAQAYGCVRLGSYLALTREHDPDASVRLAAYALLCLRHVEHTWGLGLAVDTIERSILPTLNQAMQSIRGDSRFALAVALGAFHRDYGDVLAASGAFTLAFSIARRLGPAFIASDEYVRLTNHWRILMVGVEAAPRGKEMAEYLRRRARYRETSHGEMNDDLWDLRPVVSSIDADDLLARINGVERKFLHGDGFAEYPMRPKRGIKVSRAMQRAFLEVRAEAEDRVGRRQVARDLVRLSRQVGRAARIGVNCLAQPGVVRRVAQEYSGDPAFDIPFRYPGLLLLPRPQRTRGGTASLARLSLEVRLRLHAAECDDAARVVTD